MQHRNLSLRADPKLTSTRASVAVVPSSVDEANRSVEFVAATEAPAQVLDPERWEVVDEILMMDGVQIPSNKQVPFLDSHDRQTVAAVLGSMRDFRVEGGKLIGRAYFSKKQLAFDAYLDVANGHLTDVSVGYQVLESVWIDEGQKYAYNGRTYAGPVKLSTKWALKEVSLTPIGADSGAKARQNPIGVNLTANPEAVKEFVRAVVDQIVESAKSEPQEIIEAGINKPRENDGQTAGIENPQEETTVENTNTPTTPTPPAVDQERIATETMTRAADILAICQESQHPEMASDFIKRNATLDQVRAEMLKKVIADKAPVTNTVSVEMGRTDGEKFFRAASHAMTLRAIPHIGAKALRGEVDPGAAHMAGIGFESLGRAILRRNGIDSSWMTKAEIIDRALQIRSTNMVPGQNSGDFTAICANVATLTAMAGWNYAEQNWRMFCRIGNLPDFRAAKRVRLSDAPTLLLKPEGSEIKVGTFSDTGENVTLVTYAIMNGITREALVNDLPGVFNEIFFAYGASAGDLVNSLPFAVLSDNAALADTGLLFNTTAISTAGGHANQASSGGAISIDTIAAGRASMMKKVAPNGRKLNIKPAFLLCGPDYLTTAETILLSTTNPTAEMSSGVINPFKGRITPIGDANISGNAWYLAADPALAPTIEMSFLNGITAPTVTQEETSPVQGMMFSCFIDVTAKALDFRGLYKNPGA